MMNKDIISDTEPKKLESAPEQNPRPILDALTPVEEIFDNVELEKRLDDLREQIKDHRMEAGGKCWYFGLEGIDADYGASWDSARYWHALLKGKAVSSITSKEYRKLKGMCCDCEETTKEMNKTFKRWQVVMKVEDYVEVPKRKGFLRRILCCS